MKVPQLLPAYTWARCTSHKRKQGTTLYMYLFLGDNGIYLEVELKILLFPTWQASSTDSILKQHNFSVTKTGCDLHLQKGFSSRGREEREAPAWQALTSGHLSQMDTERHLLFQQFILGWLAEPPPQLHHTWGAPNWKMKHHQVPAAWLPGERYGSDRSSQLRHYLNQLAPGPETAQPSQESGQ